MGTMGSMEPINFEKVFFKPINILRISMCFFKMHEVFWHSSLKIEYP